MYLQLIHLESKHCRLCLLVWCLPVAATSHGCVQQGAHMCRSQQYQLECGLAEVLHIVVHFRPNPTMTSSLRRGKLGRSCVLYMVKAPLIQVTSTDSHIHKTVTHANNRFAKFEHMETNACQQACSTKQHAINTIHVDGDAMNEWLWCRCDGNHPYDPRVVATQQPVSLLPNEPFPKSFQ
jgi:hypothetical protein